MSRRSRSNPVPALREAPLPYADGLDATRGIPSAQLAGSIDVHKRITLPRLAGYIGGQLGEFSTTVDGVAGEPLIDSNFLLQSLIEKAAGRRFTNRPQHIDQPYLEVTSKSPQALTLPDVATSRHAVGFSAADYLVLRRSPQALAKTAMAHVIDSTQALQSQPERHRRARSGAAQALAQHHKSIERIEKRTAHEREMARALFRQVRLPERVGKTPQNQFRADNLARAMHQFDLLFFAMLQTAAHANTWSTAQLHAAQKASVAARYCAPDEAAIAAAWRDQLGTFGLYTNARLQRIDELKRRTEQEYAEHECFQRVHYTNESNAA